MSAPGAGVGVPLADVRPAAQVPGGLEEETGAEQEKQ